MKVAVVGLGVCGAAAARALALAGAEVVVHECRTPGAGTTGTTFGWVNAHRKEPPAYHRLNAAGVAEHRLLARDAVGPAWFFPTGCLEWALDADGDEQLAATVTRLAERGHRTAWLSPARVRDHEPDLVVPPGVDAVASFPDEGHVLPVALLARLWGEARDRGARLRCPARVEGIDDAGDGVVVHVAGQEPTRADAVVLATGRWTAAVPMADPDAAGSASVGFLGYTDPVPCRLGGVVTTPRLNVRPDGGGRLVVQALDLDVDADPAAPPAVDGPAARTLLGRLAEVLTGAQGARLDALRVGQRAVPTDGVSAVGFARPRVYVMATHSGITLAPLLGRLAAEEIVGGRESDLLADFRPQRFEAAPPRTGPPDGRPPRGRGERPR